MDEVFFIKYVVVSINNSYTYSPGTDMTVDCLSGSLIISDTLVYCMLLDESGSDIFLIMACKQHKTQNTCIHILLTHS